jgi:prepilin-type N-terminal cleavage/methylation domain-containing protein
VRAFTLTEVLIALAIFALGFISVAAIFPVAALMQKETVVDLVGQQFDRSVIGLLKGRPFKAADLNNHPYFVGANEDLEVHPILLHPSEITGFERWVLNARSYFHVPYLIDYYSIFDSDTSVYEARVNDPLQRPFYWVPLARRKNIPTAAGDWVVYVFILSRSDPFRRTGKQNGNDVIVEDFNRYDRAGLDAWSGWANYDGYDNTHTPYDPVWHIPGVYGIDVTLSPNDVFRFNFDNDRNNDGRPDEIQAGDQVLDSNGTIHSVVTADATGVNVSGPILPVPEAPNKVWYGRPATAGKKSPTRGILVLTGGSPPNGVVMP